MEKFSRRDFLNLSGTALKSAVISGLLPNLSLDPILELKDKSFKARTEFAGPYIQNGLSLLPSAEDASQNKDAVPNSRVEIVGPNLNLTTTDEASPGDRALYFDNHNAGFGLLGIQQGSPGQGYLRKNGGHWEEVSIPVSVRDYMGDPSPRHFIGIGDEKMIGVYDFSVFYYDGSSFINIYPEGLKDSRVLQTVCAYPVVSELPSGRKFLDTRIVVGGTDMLQGLITTTLSKVKETMEFNRKNPKIQKEYEWKRIEELSNPNGSFIRGFDYDPVSDVLFFGGWIGQNNKCPRGTGIICLNSKTLKEIKNHPFIFEDYLGRMPVNSIKVFYHKNHHIVVVGAERSEILEDLTPHRNTGFLKIFVDGIPLPEEKVNCKRIAERTGGIDIITSAGGIEIIEKIGILAVSSYSKHVSAVSLDDIIDKGVKPLNWVRITQNPIGSRDFGAVHIGTTEDENGNPILYSGRIEYGQSKYQPAAFIHFET